MFDVTFKVREQLEKVKIRRFAMLLSLTLCRIIAAFTECIVSD